MSFNDNIHLDPSRVRTSGAGRKIAGAGGGSILGVLLILGFSYLTGIDLTSLISSQAPSSSSSSSSVDVSTCKTGADANERVECRMVATAQSLDEVWKTQLADQHAGVSYELPDFQIFTNSVSTACGSATSAVGPFYCPGDSTVYLDLGFFDEMVTQYGASDSVLAQEYVVAHEWATTFRTCRVSSARTTRARPASQGAAFAPSCRLTAMRACGCTGRLLPPILRRASPTSRPRRLTRSWVPSRRPRPLATTACRRSTRGRRTPSPGHTAARSSARRGCRPAWTPAALRRATRGMFPAYDPRCVRR